MMAGRCALIIDRWMQVTFLLARAASPRILTPLCSLPPHHHTCEKSPVGSPAYWSPKHLEKLLFVLEGELEWDSSSGGGGSGGGGGTERPTPSSRHQYAVVWYSSSAETRRPVHGILIFYPNPPFLHIAPHFFLIFTHFYSPFLKGRRGGERINLTEITEWRHLPDNSIWPNSVREGIIVGPAMDSSAGEHGMARSGLFLLLTGLMWRFGGACPESCTCSISRIVCIDSEPGIEDFPVLTLDDMENITEM